MNSITSGSWKTSCGGIAMILTGLAALFHAEQNGTITTDTMTVAATAITGGLGLIFARDNDKSSESQGVTPQQLAAKSVLANPSSTPTTTVITHAPAAPTTPPTP
jgi:hypothetical protein